MPQPVKVVGGGISQAGVEQAVDPTFNAARICVRPLDYANLGQILGHYRVVGLTAAILPSANAILAALRWTDASRFFALLKLSASVAVATAVTAQRVDPLAAFIARAYSVRDLTNATSVAFTANRSNAMRTAMGQTVIGNADVASAAAGLTGGTKLVDTNAFGHAGLSGAALAALGTGQLKQDLYKCDIANGEHPVILAQNEGILLQWGATALATGTVVVSVEAVWAEVALF